MIEKIYQLFAKFFWSGSGGVKGKHWVAWNDLCYPMDQGRLGFWSLHDVNRALFAKLWWKFKVSNSSLWANYLWNKYCKKIHPIIVSNSETSQTWRKMIQVREEVKHDIWWKIKASNCNFCFDNWTEIGTLYYIENKPVMDEDVKVRISSLMVCGIQPN